MMYHSLRSLPAAYADGQVLSSRERYIRCATLAPSSQCDVICKDCSNKMLQSFAFMSPALPTKAFLWGPLCTARPLVAKKKGAQQQCTFFCAHLFSARAYVDSTVAKSVYKFLDINYIVCRNIRIMITRAIIR